MASVLHRTTKQYLSSANTPDYSSDEWIINPDLSLVESTPIQYWIIEGDLVRPASIEEQQSIDKFSEYEGMTLDQVKQRIHSKINKIRDQYIDSGVIFKGFLFDSDQRARENITGVNAAIQNGLVIPSDFTWRSHYNENVPVTTAELSQLGIGLVMFVSACYSVGWFHKDFIDSHNETDPAFYINYDYMVGWPNKSIDGTSL